MVGFSLINTRVPFFEFLKDGDVTVITTINHLFKYSFGLLEFLLCFHYYPLFLIFLVFLRSSFLSLP
ncbi:hypothetical protein Hanom_Chr07g00585811 [Helianthus anomalus]